MSSCPFGVHTWMCSSFLSYDLSWFNNDILPFYNLTMTRSVIMRRLLPSIAFIIFAILLSAPSFAQNLWGPTKVGMSTQQVINLVTGAYRPSPRDSLGTGAIELVRVDNQEIVNKRFTQSFFFKNDNLGQVSFSLDNPASYSSALATFNNLKEVLSAKYGNAMSSSSQSIGNMKTLRSSWMSGETNIGLFLLSIGDARPTLKINYQTRIADEAGKL